MDSEQRLKSRIVELNARVREFVSRGRDIEGMPAGAFDAWRATCDSIQHQLEEEIVRVAVVGPIKSGKSTFINSIFRGDFLKRGAGVVTSIVTRARRGEHLAATLHFKSVTEVNRDINQALVLLPSFEKGGGPDGFDIRRAQDRGRLRDALDTLGAEQWFTRSSRNPNGVLLASYLEGYPAVETILAEDAVTRRFADDRFRMHQDFAGSDARAVYLQDIDLSIDSGPLGRDIEIADCQGSDSANPLHLAMIQDYLQLTHLILYVISSRTGLRRADIRFLNMIRNMGLMQNLLFVVNCDMSEHDSLDNLRSVVSDSAREIAVIKPEPEIFTLSALYSLFQSERETLSERDRLRLANWEGEGEMAQYLTSEAARFEAVLQALLERRRRSLLLGNHLERLDLIVSGALQHIGVTLGILGRDASGAREVAERIAGQREKMEQIKSGLRTTLAGSVERLKKRIRLDTDHFFDPHSGEAVAAVGDFIRRYDAPLPQDDERLDAAGFSSNLYLMYQDFKQALDGVMAEKVNAEVIRFVRDTERRICADLGAIAEPYAAIVQEALADYAQTLDGQGISAPPVTSRKIAPPDLDAIKSAISLSLPPASAGMRYSTRVKTETTLRLGFYRVLKLVKQIFKRPIANPREEQIRALNDGLKQIKRETEQSVNFHFKNFRENLKFAYFFKLAEAVADYFLQAVVERFQASSADLLQMVEAVNRRRTDKDRISASLEEMALEARGLSERIEGIKSAVGDGVGPNGGSGGPQAGDGEDTHRKDSAG